MIAFGWLGNSNGGGTPAGNCSVDAHVARRAVRHPAPALGQNRRSRGRNEDDDPRASADLMSRAGGLALRPFANAPPRHLRRGGVTPQESNPSRQPANPFTPRSGLSQETARSVRHNGKTKINPPSVTHQAARCSRRCIMRASASGLTERPPTVLAWSAVGALTLTTLYERHLEHLSARSRPRRGTDPQGRQSRRVGGPPP